MFRGYADQLSFNKFLDGSRSTKQTRRAVLIVDDDQGVARLVAHLVADRFDDVYTAKSLAEADAVLKQHNVDFAILDFMLPDGSGVELGISVRRRFEVPVVIMTGGIPEPEDEALCNEFELRILRKPFTPRDLQSLVAGRQIGPVIFIGHGRSQEWKDLRHFLLTRLHLTCEKFNSDSAAGLPTIDRLQHMLRVVQFAFLVMTSEDVHSDGSIHARENVVHEAGLFQGRLGFERAIILLEEGCTKFSNIYGLTHIAFPKGRIEAAFEQVRLVLERERIIPVDQI